MEKEIGNKLTKEKKDLGKLFRDNIQKVIIFLVSGLYITQGIFSITKRDVSLWDIAGSIGISIVMGLIVTSSFRNMGLRAGRKDQSFINSMEAYGKAKVEATPYFDKITGWCDYKNIQELELAKKDIIQRAGLNWKAFKFGYYEEHQDKLTDEQKIALEKAKMCQISKLQAQELLSDFPKDRKNRAKFGRSVQKYTTRDATLDTFSRILIGVIFGIYGLSPIAFDEHVVSGLIWNSFQMILWLTFGSLKYFDAFSFMVDEYRQSHIISKTEYLNEFVITVKNNPDVIDKYSEEPEIDKYIEEYIKEKESKEKVVKNEQGAILD